MADAAGTGVAQSIANEKKNTLSGLWAQVESTFTEGILQALEGRQGGWAGELMKLRDYLAKPETVQMLSSIVDMVEQLARVIQYFAKAWARIYNTFPKLINFWMYAQLAFTQLGYLATPIIQILSALDKFGVGKATAGAVAATGETAAEMALNAHNNELKQRYINRYGYKGVAKRTWTGGFSVGRAMGTLSFASMFSGLKNMALSLFGGLAKAIGLLVSPVGLAVTGITALGSVLYMVYERNKAYTAQMRKNAENYSKSAKESRKSDLKAGKDIIEKYDKIFWGGNIPTVSAPSFTPTQTQQKNTIKSVADKYKDALDTSQNMDDANRIWLGDIASNPSVRLGFNKSINELNRVC